MNLKEKDFIIQSLIEIDFNVLIKESLIGEEVEWWACNSFTPSEASGDDPNDFVQIIGYDITEFVKNELGEMDFKRFSNNFFNYIEKRKRKEIVKFSEKIKYEWHSQS